MDCVSAKLDLPLCCNRTTRLQRTNSCNAWVRVLPMQVVRLSRSMPAALPPVNFASAILTSCSKTSQEHPLAVVDKDSRFCQLRTAAPSTLNWTRRMSVNATLDTCWITSRITNSVFQLVLSCLQLKFLRLASNIAIACPDLRHQMQTECLNASATNRWTRFNCRLPLEPFVVRSAQPWWITSADATVSQTHIILSTFSPKTQTRPWI